MLFSSWLYVVCGAIILIVLVDIILPQGRMIKYVKSFSALLIFVVIISPIVGFLKNTDSASIEENLNLNQSIISNIGSRQIENSKILFESKVRSELGAEVFVEIDYFLEEQQPIIETVYIYLTNIGITQNPENINSIEQLILMAQNYFKIDSGQVIVYE